MADDHEMFSSGVIELLESAGDIEVVGQGTSGDDAIRLAAEHRPDVIVIDIEMPGPGGPGTIQAIARASPRSRCVVLTMHDDPQLVRDVFTAGAAGYLLKSAGRQELVAAISTSTRGDDVVLLSVSRRTLVSLAESNGATDESVLSPRELEVLTLLADAKSNRDIAADLFISGGTVKRHLANIYAKLDATSRIDAVRRGRQLGVLGEDG